MSLLPPLYKVGDRVVIRCPDPTSKLHPYDGKKALIRDVYVGPASPEPAYLLYKFSKLTGGYIAESRLDAFVPKQRRNKVKVSLTSPTVATPQLDPNSLILEEAKEHKEYVPNEEWFKDTGIMTPIKVAIINNKPVLLKGETGVGKTSAIRYLASKTKNGFRRVNLNGSTTVDEFVGRWKLNKDREMVWIDGVLVEAMRKGLWLVCDEINACLPEISFVLHSLLDDDRMIVLSSKDGEIVRPHPDFRFFATMNPEYAGTHALNHAFEDRFPIVVYVDYPTASQEVEIVSRKSGNLDKVTISKMVAVAAKARVAFKAEQIMSSFSTRKLIDWATLAKTFSVTEAFRYSVLNKIPKEDQVALLDTADAIFPGGQFKVELKLS